MGRDFGLVYTQVCQVLEGQPGHDPFVQDMDVRVRSIACYTAPEARQRELFEALSYLLSFYFGDAEPALRLRIGSVVRGAQQ